MSIKWRTSRLIEAVALGAFGSLVSLLRVSVSTVGLVPNVLWAEDGLFPLCIRNYGVVNCLREPYSGWPHSVPKLLGAVIALFPLSSWAILANFVAASAVGVVVALVFVLVTRAGGARSLGLIMSLIPVFHPVLSVESINSYANLYIPVAFLALIMYCFPNALRGNSGSLVAYVTFIAILTVPSLLVVLVVGLWFDSERQVNTRRWVSVVVVGGVAIVVNLLVASRQQSERQIGPNAIRLFEYLRLFPVKIWDSLVGFDYGREAIYQLNSQVRLAIGSTIVLSVFVLAIFARRRSLSLRAAVGLTASGILLSLIPSLAYGVIDRYFVWLSLPVSAAFTYVLLGTSRVSRSKKVLVSLLAVSWLFGGAFPAAESRVTPSYSWSRYLSEARDRCRASQISVTEIYFAPNWPFDEGSQLQASGLHSNRVRCTDL